ncbi:unnamed protein product, partial [Discosporangium mesarthrocarpum]
PQVEFEDVRPGLLFVLTFSVQNKSAETRRIRLVPPSTPMFSLNYEPASGIAPGLDVRAEVEFQLPEGHDTADLDGAFAEGEVREYRDRFLVISGKDTVEVPLVARRPVPAVEHEGILSFGQVASDRKAHGTITLVNKGSRKGTYLITWDKSLPITITPAQVSTSD